MSTVLETGRCGSCGTELAPSLLACPRCGRLVHTEELKARAADAEQRHREGDPTGALGAWRGVLELLPEGSAQHAAVAERIAALGREVDASPVRSAARGGTAASVRSAAANAQGKPTGTHRWAKLGAVGAVLLVLVKFKTVIFFALGKAKLLLLGFTKLGTLSSMLLSFGVYAELWGWKFALGVILSLYVHEMGHVAALARYGVHATAPMFVPGFGAFVRAKQHITDPRQDARIGLAGPIWGLGAAVAAYVAYRVTEQPVLAAIAGTGAWLNLFNLLPIGPLDGGRGFRSLSRLERWIVVGILAATFVWTREGSLALIAIVGATRAFVRETEATSDPMGVAIFGALVASLSLLTMTTHGLLAVR